MLCWFQSPWHYPSKLRKPTYKGILLHALWDKFIDMGISDGAIRWDREECEVTGGVGTGYKLIFIILLYFSSDAGKVNLY